MTDLCKLSGLVLGRMIASREIKPSEVMQAVLDRIDQTNPQINAYCTVDPDLAMAEAGKADERVARGDAAGPLFGVPVSIKDLIVTKGLRTTFGCLHLEKNVPEVDAVLVERLRAAGSPVIGKTNTPEFGGKFATDNAVFGATRNPWNLQRSTGRLFRRSRGGGGAGMGPLPWEMMEAGPSASPRPVAACTG